MSYHAPLSPLIPVWLYILNYSIKRERNKENAKQQCSASETKFQLVVCRCLLLPWRHRLTSCSLITTTTLIGEDTVIPLCVTFFAGHNWFCATRQPVGPDFIIPPVVKCILSLTSKGGVTNSDQHLSAVFISAQGGYVFSAAGSSFCQ